MTHPLRLFLLLCVVAVTAPAQPEPRTYTNPILAGFYSDPSVCRVGEDYYIVTSTFAYFPGLPVMHSKDLVNWTQIGSVLDRPSQLNLDGAGVSEGLFAPSIRYDRGRFYVTCTLVSGGGNFVVTASDPAGPWSEPAYIPQVSGIDPSMFFDDDGKAYILYNSVAPDDKPLYDGHRTIRMYEFDVASMKVVGAEQILVNGGSDISKKPIWIEGPHIFRKDGYYYLICAEGGTADLHSQVVFRSRGVWGPYESYAGNPILTQRHLPIPRPDPVTTAGHADFVETQNGEWWAVFLACRPYILRSPQEEFYNTGRETWLARVVWREGWPIVDLQGDVVKYRYNAPALPEQPRPLIPTSGNFTYRDEFDTPTLRLNWAFLRTPRSQWYDLTSDPGSLILRVRPETASGKANPTFLGHRQQHLSGTATISLSFSGTAENEKAGLLVVQSEKHHYFLARSTANGRPVVQLFRSNSAEPETGPNELMAQRDLPSPESPVVLRIEAKRDTYAFWYGETPDALKLLMDSVDAKFLNTRYPQGFVGCMYALYASSHGAPSETTATIHWFEVSGKDPVYDR